MTSPGPPEPVPDSVIVAKAPLGEILFSNRHANRVIGRRLSELAADFPIFHLDGRAYSLEERQIPRSLASGEEIIDEEFFGPGADEEGVRYRCSCWPVHDGGGRVVAAVAVTRDVTVQKRREERLGYLAGLLDNTEDAVVAMDEQYLLTTWNRGAERLYGWSAAEVVGRHANEVAGTDLSEAERTALRRELIETGRWRGEVAVARKDGTTVDVELVSVALRGEQGDISGYLTIHRDISERKRAAEEQDRSTRRQALVAQLGLRALATGDLQGLIDEAVALVAQTLDVELAGVAEIVDGDQGVLFRAGVGWGEAGVGWRIGRDGHDSLMAYTLSSREPVIVEDLATDARFDASAPARDHGAVSALSIMIANPDEPFGALAALSRSRRTFSESDVSFLQAVANVLAGAVERTRAQERISDVREAERRRLARDLHDEALQELTVALGQAQRREPSAARAGGPDPLVSTLKRVGEHLRGAIYDLRLDDQGDRAFSHLLEVLVALHGAMAVSGQVELDLRDDVPSTPLGTHGTEILRLVGEALTNARRHAQASTVRVVASGARGRLCVEVSDDGCGFDPGAAPSAGAGTGITGMRERAALLGGDLDITSWPGKGTRVRLDVALGEGPEAERRDVRVLLVEDHAAVRQAIAAMFEREPDFDVVGQAASLAEARGMLNDVDVDVAVVDLGLPDGCGGDLIKEISVVSPRAQVLVLSAGLDRTQIARAIRRGAAGTLDKLVQLDELVDAVRRLRAGETLIPPDEVLELLRFAGQQREQEHRDRAAVDSLTPREVEVLQALAQGLDSRAIAARLFISVRTERDHIASILAKFGVHSRLQALVFAIRYGVVEVR